MLDEIKVSSNMEELKAKEYAATVGRLQTALKQEKQIKITEAINQKQKSAKVKPIKCFSIKVRIFT